jgi:hypothetical protein
MEWLRWGARSMQWEECCRMFANIRKAHSRILFSYSMKADHLPDSGTIVAKAYLFRWQQRILIDLDCRHG